MPFKVEGSRALTVTYKIRLSPENKDWLRRQAESSGMTMAKFIRHRALGLAIVSRADLTVLAELRRIGGLLKYTGTQMSSDGQGAVVQTMTVLRDYVKGITDDRQESPKS